MGTEHEKLEAGENEAATLGDVLFGRNSARLVTEGEWLVLVQSIAAGDQRALFALYSRMHRIVFTLTMRIVGSRETAEEVTVDVFHDVWRRAAAYDPANGSVIGWVINQARSRAIDRLRYEQRKKRVNEFPENPASATDSGPAEAIEQRERASQLRSALALLTQAERQAIERAFFAELTYAEVAAQLNEPLGTIKTRIRSGLSKLKQALAKDSR